MACLPTHILSSSESLECTLFFFFFFLEDNFGKDVDTYRYLSSETSIQDRRFDFDGDGFSISLVYDLSMADQNLGTGR